LFVSSVINFLSPSGFHPSTTLVSPSVCSFIRPYISSVRPCARLIRPSISSIRLFARSSIYHFRESVPLLVHPSINLISFVCSFIRPSISLVHMFTNSFVHQFLNSSVCLFIQRSIS
jgi:hypothetical protein